LECALWSCLDGCEHAETRAHAIRQYRKVLPGITRNPHSRRPPVQYLTCRPLSFALGAEIH